MDEQRFTYLLEWRKGLWVQIRQKEDAVWRFVSVYAGSLVLLAGLLQFLREAGNVDEISGIVAFVSLVNLLLSLLGVLFVLDANYWMQRNLLFVGNIERELLDKEDFGTLLPKDYAYLYVYKFSRGYEIHIWFFSLLFFLSLLAITSITVGLLQAESVISSLEITLYGVFSLLLGIGVKLILDRDKSWIADFFRVRKNAPGRNPESDNTPDEFREIVAVNNSPVTRLFWAGAVLGSGISIALLLVLISNVYQIPNPVPPIAVYLMAIVILILGYLTMRGIQIRAKAYKAELQQSKGNPDELNSMLNSQKGLIYIRSILPFLSIVAWVIFLLVMGFSAFA